MSLFRGHRTFEALLLALFDMMCFLSAYLIAIMITQPSKFTFGEWFLSQIMYLILISIAWIFEAMSERLFVSRRSEALVPQLFSVVKAISLSIILSSFVMAHIGPYGLERRFVLAFSIPCVLMIVIFRLMVRLSLWGIRRRGYNYRRIMLVGANERTAHLAEVIQSHEQYGYQLEGFLEDDKERCEILAQFNVPYLGKIKKLEELLVDRIIDVVYISLPVRSHYQTIQSIAHLCEGVGVQVRLIADLFPLRIATSGATKISDIPLLTLSSNQNLKTSFALRRLTDTLVASILLFMLSPILITLAVLIKLESKGPVFVKEPCVSADLKRRFNLFKFRIHHLPTTDAEEPVLTLCGKQMHIYNLDELPQLFNVWSGTMSFTEPRPIPFDNQIDSASLS